MHAATHKQALDTCADAHTFKSTTPSNMNSYLHDRRDGQTHTTYAGPTRTKRGATSSPQRPWCDMLTTKPRCGDRLTTVADKELTRRDYSIHIFDTTWTTTVFFVSHSLSVGQQSA